MQIEANLSLLVEKYFENNFQNSIASKQINFQETRKEFTGDLTLVVFPFLRITKKSPEQTAQNLGEFLLAENLNIIGFNVVKGFLNLELSNAYLQTLLSDYKALHSFEKTNQKYLVEYSSPNTNKPLHLGHIRNNLLGYSVSKILQEAGNEVFKVQIINDRGIHICKSMLAWQKNGNGETPQSSGLKGDKLVGKYYVTFDKMYKAEIADLIANGMEEKEAIKEAPILKEAQEMLQKWEAGNTEINKLWKTMNDWVYQGFDETYKALGVDFDKLYYESYTYLLGKDHVMDGVEKGIFYQKEDGSVWVDLESEGLDHKLLLRSDGTSVYMTQDIGTAIERYKDFDMDAMIYTVGNEQDYHFKVLFLILKKLGFKWAENCFHLSYGMVDLPSGKMKSREGTVVDADDLIEEVIEAAKERTKSLGKIEFLNPDEQANLYKKLGLGALKYFILKVDPKRKMLFDPEQSIDLQGNTGPFIQYAHARIQAILTRGNEALENWKSMDVSVYQNLEPVERDLILLIAKFPEIVLQASKDLSPALVASYAYDLASNYNRFYQACPIFTENKLAIQAFRIQLSEAVGTRIKKALALLGIEAPDQM